MEWLEVVRTTRDGSRKAILVGWIYAMPYIPRTDDTCPTGHVPRITTGTCPCLQWDLDDGVEPDLQGVRSQVTEDPECPDWYGEDSEMVLRPIGVMFVGPEIKEGAAAKVVVMDQHPQVEA